MSAGFEDDTRYITPQQRAEIRATLSGGWDGPLDMERDLLDHADVMDALVAALRHELGQRDKQFDRGYEGGRYDERMEVVKYLRDAGDATVREWQENEGTLKGEYARGAMNEAHLCASAIDRGSHVAQ